MKPIALPVLLAVALTPAGVFAQVENMGPKAATYITDEDVKRVNALPGVDRQIVSVDIGKLNEAVGIVHRGAPNAPPAGGASRRRRTAPRAAAPCGEQTATPPRADRAAASRTTTRPRPTSSSPAAARWSPAAGS